MKFQSLLFTMLVAVLSFAQVPTITSFSPAQAAVGSTVTISGTNFSSTAASNIVRFGSVLATVNTASTTQLTVTVPSGAIYAPISVTVSNKIGQSRLPFHIINPNTSSSVGTSTSNWGAGVSIASGTYSAEAMDMIIAAGDFDGNGWPDVVKIGSGNLHVHRNLISSAGTTISSSSFSAATTLATDGTANCVITGDVNADGKLDIISSGSSGINIFINNSSAGSFSFAAKYLIPTSGSNIVRVADIDRDGLLDFVGFSGADVKIWKNTTSMVSSTWTFSVGTVTTVNVDAATSGTDNIESFDLGDMNLDGKIDIVLTTANATSGGCIKFVANTNSTAGTMSVTYSNSDIAVGGGLNLGIADIDADGDLDVMTRAWKLLRNDNPGTITSTAFSSSFTTLGLSLYEYLYGIAFSDFRGIGRLDITGGTSWDKSWTHFNLSNPLTTSSFPGNTTSRIQIGAATSSYGVCTGPGLGVDLNGDDKIDFLSSSHYNSSFAVIQNLMGPQPPAFTTQPSISPSTICAGTSFTTNTVAASNNPTSYQWEVSTDNGTTWANVSGASASTTQLTSTPSTAGTYLYRCKATNAAGTGISSNVTLTVNALPALTTQPTTTAVVKCYSSAADVLTVATSASSPSYQWQQSITAGGTYTNVSTGSNFTTAAFSPSHSNIWSNGKTMYYRCIVTSGGCSTTSNSSASYKVTELTQLSQPSTTAQNVCINSSATTLTVSADNTGLPITYIWQSATTSNGSYSTAVGNTGTNSFTPPSSSAGTLYYRCYYQFCGGLSQASNPSGAITVTDTYTWTGAVSSSSSNPSNWNPGAPCSSASIVIPSNVTNFPEFSSGLMVYANTTFTIQSGAKITILSGNLVNFGTVTIESGATLVQGANSACTGSGTYNVKQAITGAGTTTPTGRFWYLGSPVSAASSSVYFGNAANVVKKRDEVNNAWTALSSGTPENLVVGKGYYTQAMANSTVTFTGGVVNNGAISISGLSRTTGVGYEGFNLVSNPYPSYLNWDAVTRTNVDGTIWYRTHDGSNMVFDTYVANAAGGIGTNLSGNTATKYIPPMQSFWVRVSQGQSSGSLALDNTMRSHFASLGSSTAGLRSTNDELKLFLRMNLLQDAKKDQLIVYVNGNATNGFDVLDGEKMMQATLPQFYTSAAGKKITINGLNSAKKQQSLPITMELPTTGVHSFQIEDLEIDNGLVWLEDKQEEIMQALEPGSVYEFYANSGINAERFVLHFQLIDDATPVNVYNEVGSFANFNGKGAAVHAEAAGVVVIKLPATTEGVTDIQIRDAAGKLVYSGSTSTLETSVQLTQANGIYYVTLNSTNGVEVRKVFVQQ